MDGGQFFLDDEQEVFGYSESTSDRSIPPNACGLTSAWRLRVQFRVSDEHRTASDFQCLILPMKFPPRVLDVLMGGLVPTVGGQDKACLENCVNDFLSQRPPEVQSSVVKM